MGAAGAAGMTVMAMTECRSPFLCAAASAQCCQVLIILAMDIPRVKCFARIEFNIPKHVLDIVYRWGRVVFTIS